MYVYTCLENDGDMKMIGDGTTTHRVIQSKQIYLKWESNEATTTNTSKEAICRYALQ